MLNGIWGDRLENATHSPLELHQAVCSLSRALLAPGHGRELSRETLGMTGLWTKQFVQGTKPLSARKESDSNQISLIKKKKRLWVLISMSWALLSRCAEHVG